MWPINWRESRAFTRRGSILRERVEDLVSGISSGGKGKEGGGGGRERGRKGAYNERVPREKRFYDVYTERGQRLFCVL